MSWPKGKPRAQSLSSPRGRAAYDNENALLGASLSASAGVLASAPADVVAPQPPPTDNRVSGDVLMARGDRVAEVHPNSIPAMEAVGWQRCDIVR